MRRGRVEGVDGPANRARSPIIAPESRQGGVGDRPSPSRNFLILEDESLGVFCHEIVGRPLPCQGSAQDGPQ